MGFPQHVHLYQHCIYCRHSIRHIWDWWNRKYSYTIILQCYCVESFPHAQGGRGLHGWATVSESLRSLKTNEWPWGIRSGCLSNSLTSLRGNEQLWANCSGCSPKMSEWVNRSFFLVNCSFANFWPKNEWFTRKTDERILSPAFTIVGHVRRPLLEKRGGNISYLCRQCSEKLSTLLSSLMKDWRVICCKYNSGLIS